MQSKTISMQYSISEGVKTERKSESGKKEGEKIRKDSLSLCGVGNNQTAIVQR
jgi:hypothetical protein